MELKIVFMDQPFEQHDALNKMAGREMSLVGKIKRRLQKKPAANLK